MFNWTFVQGADPRGVPFPRRGLTAGARERSLCSVLDGIAVRADEWPDLRLLGVVFYTDNGTRRETLRDRKRMPVETAEACSESAAGPKVVVVSEPDLPRPPEPRP